MPPHWDPVKRDKVWIKHKVKFEDVQHVFIDGYYVYIEKQYRNGEERNLFIGRTKSGRFYEGSMIVVNGDERLITAWKAGSDRIDFYEENRLKTENE